MAATVVEGICWSHDRVQSVSEQGLLEIPASYIRPAEERPNIRISSSLKKIPVIDLAEGGPDISVQVGQACRDWGFFQVSFNLKLLFLLCFFRVYVVCVDYLISSID